MKLALLIAMFVSTPEAQIILRQTWRDVMHGFAPPPSMTTTQWAEEFRSLSPESAAEPGRFRVARTPYMQEIMDAFDDPNVRTVVVMTSAQVGKSTAIENVLGKRIHLDPLPIMAVQPTLELAETYSKDRISPMIRDCEVLRALVHEANARSSGNTIKQKKFPGGHLTITGANSPTSLRSRPIGLLLGDELDAWKDTPEGDPCTLVEARTKRFPNAKIGYFSTPTVEGESRIAAKYEESDQRKVYVPCFACGESFVLTFETLKWREGKSFRAENGREIRRADEAWFECSHCNAKLTDVARARAIAHGQWMAHSDFHGVAGFWLWEANNPSSRAVDMANAWLSAQGDIQKLQAVKNTVFGLPWKESGHTLDWRRLYDRAESYRQGVCPEGVRVLFAGSDVQKNRIEIYVWGYGDNLEQWLVDHVVIPGSVYDDATWTQLTQALNTTYKAAGGERLPIKTLAIDSGFEAPLVYQWATKFPPSRVMVFKGEPDGQTYLRRGKNIELLAKSGAKTRTAHELYLANNRMLKDQAYGWLSSDAPTREELADGSGYPIGFTHFPHMPEEFFRQLTAEAKVGGKYDKVNYDRNEALDCKCYADALAWFKGVQRYHKSEKPLPMVAEVIQPEAPKVQQPRPSSGGSWFGDRRKNWMGR